MDTPETLHMTVEGHPYCSNITFEPPLTDEQVQKLTGNDASAAIADKIIVNTRVYDDGRSYYEVSSTRRVDPATFNGVLRVAAIIRDVLKSDTLQVTITAVPYTAKRMTA